MLLRDMSMYLCQLREETVSHRKQRDEKGLDDHYKTEKSIHKKKYQARAGK